jgi:hypothetical protein
VRPVTSLVSGAMQKRRFWLAGLLYGMANAIIARSKDPDRLTSVLMGGSMTPGIALAYLIPVFLVPQFGVGVGFCALAASVLVPSLFTITLVDKLSSLERPETTRVPLHLS